VTPMHRDSIAAQSPRSLAIQTQDQGIERIGLSENF
jgi:hypothetical protein